MNTRFVMTSSAVLLGVAGIVLTFIPDSILALINVTTNSTALFLVQILGALYFAFGMLNWMTKTSLIGGIYNRPVAVANFSHFAIGGLALVKGVISKPGMSHLIWVVAMVYFAFGLLFGLILFRNPAREGDRNT